MKKVIAILFVIALFSALVAAEVVQPSKPPTCARSTCS
jgi:hypothetical protein